MSNFKQFKIEDTKLDPTIIESGGRSILSKGEFQSPNYVREKKGWKISSEGDAEFQKVHIGSQLVTLAPGDSLQDAIDELASGDGGHILLQAGTYTIETTVNLKSAIQIIGENTSTTIIDFNNTAGTLKATGTNIYSTGTITSIANGVTVTGSGTAWLANVTTSHQFFIGNKWYKIAAITSDTVLVLSEGYTGGATFPGAAYRVAKVIKDIEIRDVTIKNSTGTALDFDDVRNIFLEDFEIIDCNKGLTMDNCAEIDINASLISSCDSNGAEFNTVGFCNARQLSTASNDGDGCVLNNFRIGAFHVCSSDSNTGDGFNITSADTLILEVQTNSNGEQGIEFVSGNANCFLTNCNAESNISDGVKLTATSDDVIITGGLFDTNGGYGLNIVNSTSDSSLGIGCIFDNNTTGAVNDSGTGTKLTGNIGVNDTGRTFSSDISIPDEAYGSGWNGSLEAPTKNAVYDKIETLSSITFKNGVDTRDLSAASGDQTIAHGLGKTPSYVRLTSWCYMGTGTNQASRYSTGVYNGTTTSSIRMDIGAATTESAGRSTTNILEIYQGGVGKSEVATIAVDATNITLSWTRAGTTDGDTLQILWEAWG